MLNNGDGQKSIALGNISNFLLETKL